MGYYLNSNRICSLYESETRKPYFIDKTDMLLELIPLVEEGNNHMAEKKRHTGRILLVGIGYNRKNKDHRCRVEIF